MTLQIGQILDGKYRIIRELGSGSMGAVYEGENVRIRRRVAIKVLLSGMARRSDSVQRFEREAQAAGRIGSEHIVEVLDLGTLPEGGFFMVMEFLDGLTLGEHIVASGRLGPRDIAPLIQQLLTGLEMAHEARVIHRDLKPDNIFLVAEHAGQKNFIKILDFGVSKFNPLNADEGMSMTRTGAVVGTPFYMAPEQAKGSRDVDHRSDLYSVGVILYEAVTGQKPFHAGTFNELIFKIVLETPPPPEQFVPNLDPAFGRIIRRAMAREPDERFQTAAEFRDALYIWLHTGRDGNKDAAQLPLPPGDFALDGEGATIMMDAAQHAAEARPPLTQPMAAVPMPATPIPNAAQQRAAAFSSGGGGLLPPQAAPSSPGSAGIGFDMGGARPPRPEQQDQNAAQRLAAAGLSDAPVRLASGSPSATTAPGGVRTPLPVTAAHPDEVWPIAGVPPKRSGKLLWGLGALAVLLLAGGGAAAFLLMPAKSGATETTGDVGKATAVADNDATAAPPDELPDDGDDGDDSSDDGAEPAPASPDDESSGKEPTGDDTAVPSAAPTDPKPVPAPRAVTLPSPRPTASPPANPRPRPTPKPRPPKPRPGPKPAPNGGRPIKVEL